MSSLSGTMRPKGALLDSRPQTLGSLARAGKCEIGGRRGREEKKLGGIPVILSPSIFRRIYPPGTGLFAMHPKTAQLFDSTKPKMTEVQSGEPEVQWYLQGGCACSSYLLLGHLTLSNQEIRASFKTNEIFSFSLNWTFSLSCQCRYLWI